MRSFACLLTIGVACAPGLAAADGLVIPGIGPEDVRPGYREAAFPPPQHGILGLPGRMPQPLDRSGYAEASQFPPSGGRYGGGFIEYMMAASSAPTLSAYSAPASSGSAASGFSLPDMLPTSAPAYRASVNPRRASLPHGGLPDYAPQPDIGATPPSAPAVPDLFGLLGGGEPFAPSAAPAPEPAGLAGRPSNPVYERRFVAYSGRERPGTVVIDTPDKFLYLVQADGRAIRYGIGVGRPGFTWAGVKSITRKAEWPGWTPPSQMVRRRPDLPRHMVGGEGNPLGARALYLGSSLYRIHGTNEPDTIGTNVSSGCIRMMNQDVIDLYGRVGVGTRVIVM